jgi:hypothetical protein
MGHSWHVPHKNLPTASHFCQAKVSAEGITLAGYPNEIEE